MAKCGGCGRFISPAEAARCHHCSSVYHRHCVSLPISGNIARSWHCPECKKNRVTDNNSETPVRGCASNLTENHPKSPPLPNTSGSLSEPGRSPVTSQHYTETASDIKSDIMSELTIFRDNLRAVNNEIRMFRDEMAEFRASLKACHVKLDSLDERVTALERVQPADNTNIDSVVARLKQEINDRDQELLANDIEIANLPEINGENTVHTTLQIAAKLGVKLDERDVISAERVGPRYLVSTDAGGPERRPRPLAVRLARRNLRDELLASARVRRGANTADLGLGGPARRFYLNERLTKTNRWLFRKVREVAQARSWQFVWCKRGRILARNKPGDKVVTIRNEGDIDNVFGHE